MRWACFRRLRTATRCKTGQSLQAVQKKCSTRCDQKSKRHWGVLFNIVYSYVCMCVCVCARAVSQWRGFAASKMELVGISADSDSEPKKGLTIILKHLKMLTSSEPRSYEFLISLLAHTVQFPHVKSGIMIFLTGKQGCGKTVVWDLIVRLVGRTGVGGLCFETCTPEKDVWGDNNGQMSNVFFCHITEPDSKKFRQEQKNTHTYTHTYIHPHNINFLNFMCSRSATGAMRNTISDTVMRTRELYHRVRNTPSYTSFVSTSNTLDAIPDSKDERRFFCLKVSDAKKDNKSYFIALNRAIENDKVMRLFYEFLCDWPTPAHFFGSDIPIGKFQRDLRFVNMDEKDRFIVHLIEEVIGVQHEDGVLVRSFCYLADELYEEYKKWYTATYGAGTERNKRSFYVYFKLASIKGFNERKEEYSPEIDTTGRSGDDEGDGSGDGGEGKGGSDDDGGCDGDKKTRDKRKTKVAKTSRSKRAYRTRYILDLVTLARHHNLTLFDDVIGEGGGGGDGGESDGDSDDDSDDDGGDNTSQPWQPKRPGEVNVKEDIKDWLSKTKIFDSLA